MARRITITDNMTKIDLRCIEQGISRRELARRSGVPLRTLENWSMRTRLPRDVYQLHKVAQALGCSIEDIMEPEPEDGPLIHGENLDAMAAQYGMTREEKECDRHLADRIAAKIKGPEG